MDLALGIGAQLGLTFVLGNTCNKPAEFFQLVYPAAPDKPFPIGKNVGASVAHILSAVIKYINGLDNHYCLAV